MSAVGKAEEPPLVLGRYELVTLIGRGGMAEVHLAVQRGPAGFEKLVVVKLVHEELATQKASVDMLLDEAKLAAQIKHPNVVDIYELGEHDGRYFIAMEYLEGEPLLELLRVGNEGNRLDPLSTARLIADTAEGLDAAHRLKSRDGTPLDLVHHDISLGNIVVLYSGLVKLVDFGVAKAAASSGDRVQGKLGYMAPEKLQERPVDRRSDIWSLGCVLWEALTLKRLFRGDTDAETLRQVLELAIEAPSKVDPRVPPELDPIVARALERDPDRRYQTAKALASDLEEVLRDKKYGARNDRIADYMSTAFAHRIAARERVLHDVSSKKRPTADVLDRAFAEPAGAARTISSTGTVKAKSEPAPNDEDLQADTLDTHPKQEPPPPPPPVLDHSSPVPKVIEARESSGARGKTGPIKPTHFVIPPPREEPIEPEPLQRPSGLEMPALPRPEPKPEPFELPRFDLPAFARDANPFGEDDSGKTIADVIPAFPDASRSLRSDPSWAASAHGSSIGELQNWVNESREKQQSRWRLLGRRITSVGRRIERRWTSIARRRKLPRWLPIPAGALILVGIVVAIARCGGEPAPVATHAVEPVAPTAPAPAPAGSAEPAEIEMGEDVVSRSPAATAPALYGEGLDALRRGDSRAALAALTKAQELDPSYAPVWYGLGLVYERIGRRGDAKAAYQRYLSLAPNAANADQIRAQIERL